MKPLVVLDFDGTFTDVEKEGAGFSAAYLRELSALVGKDVSAPWRAAESLLADPERGWEVGGHVVAPANCDPYIRSTCLAFEVCTQLGLMKTIELRTEVLSAIYAYCYKDTATAFRPEAPEVLARIRATGAHVWVVTNSEPKSVEEKLGRLGFAGLPVIGSAKKYVVKDTGVTDARFLALNDIVIEGLKRPLKVRRPFYFNVLDGLWRQTGTGPQNTFVCGDIFELDLALPLSLGCHGHLLERPNMQAYERAALKPFGPRASVSPGLWGFVERLGA